jgi:hypothetical protein
MAPPVAAHADKPPCVGDRHNYCPPNPPPIPPPTTTPPQVDANLFNVIVGSGRSDRLVGTFQRDAIFGLAGNDRLIGRARSDWLFGGRGNDVLRGGVGPAQDVMRGGSGFDTCIGDRNDVMINCERRIVVVL